MLGSRCFAKKDYDCLCLDLATQLKDRRKVASRAEEGKDDLDDVRSYMRQAALFMLVLSRVVVKESIRSRYYIRNQVEELFVSEKEGKFSSLTFTMRISYALSAKKIFLVYGK